MGMYADRAKKKRKELDEALGKEMVFTEREEVKAEEPTVKTTRRQGTRVPSSGLERASIKGMVNTYTDFKRPKESKKDRFSGLERASKAETENLNTDFLKEKEKKRDIWDRLEKASMRGLEEYPNEEIMERGNNVVKGVFKSLTASPGLVKEATKQSLNDWKEKVEREGLESALSGMARNMDNPEYNIGGSPIDKNSKAYKNYAQALEYYDKALEGLSPTKQALGSVGISALQNLVTLPTAVINPAIPLMLMGTTATADKTYELTEQGKTSTEALGRGLLSGGIEAITEKLPLDELLGALKHSGKGILRSFLKQGNIEGAEEFVSYIMNYGADVANADKDAEFSIKEAVMNYIGGFITGSAMGGGAAYIGSFNNNISNEETGRKINEINAAEDVVDVALKNEPGSKSQILAENIVIRTKRGVPVTNEEIGALYRETVKDLKTLKTKSLEKDMLDNIPKEYMTPLEAVGNIGENVPVDTSAYNTQSEISPSEIEIPSVNNAASNNISTADSPIISNLPATLDTYQFDTNDMLNRIANEMAETKRAETLQMIEESESNLGENGAKALRTYYNDTYNFDDYYNGFTRYYEASKVGLPIEQINTLYGNNIAPEVKYAAYMSGINDAQTIESNYELPHNEDITDISTNNYFAEEKTRAELNEGEKYGTEEIAYGSNAQGRSGIRQDTEGTEREIVKSIVREKAEAFWRNNRYSEAEHQRVIGRNVFTADFIKKAESSGKNVIMEEYSGETLSIAYKIAETKNLSSEAKEAVKTIKDYGFKTVIFENSVEINYDGTTTYQPEAFVYIDKNVRMGKVLPQIFIGAHINGNDLEGVLYHEIYHGLKYYNKGDLRKNFDKVFFENLYTDSSKFDEYIGFLAELHGYKETEAEKLVEELPAYFIGAIKSNDQDELMYFNAFVDVPKAVVAMDEMFENAKTTLGVLNTKISKESAEDVHDGILDGKSDDDNGIRESKPIQKAEEKQNAGTEDRELSENVIAEDRADVQVPEREASSERPIDSGDNNNGIRERDNGNGDSGIGISRDGNVDEVKKSVAKDFSITKATAEDLDTKSPSMEDNIKAIETLHDIENINKTPTKAQQAILAKFKGWGGLSNSFWGKNKERLQEIMSDSEIAAAQSTVNDAYFTPTYIIDEIYKALNYLGFEGGNILEPSMGVGNFFGRLPKSIKSNSSLFGVEIDTISGRIAKYLYPSANIEIAPFQDVAYRDNSFDLIIGNVPFGEVKYKYKNSRYLIHDYFFVKAMDKLNDGGIMAFLTSRGTLDKLDSKTRAELNRQGKLIAAYRLPSSVFTRSAGASPVTDLIIMQKTTDTNGERFVNTGSIEVDGVDFSINEYFVNHPENIIGELSVERNWRNGKYSLDVKSTGNVGEQLDRAIKKLPKNLLSGVQSVGTVNVTENTSPLQTFIAKDDGTVEYIDAQTGDIKQIKKKQAEIAKAYINVKDVYQDLVDTTLNSNDRDTIESKRKELNTEYDNFVKKYGSLEKNKKLLSADNDFFKLSGLEIYDTKTKKVIKSEMFTRDTLGKKKPKKADSALDALSISISETGGVNLERIKELTNLSEKDIVKQLSDRIVYTPDGTYELNEVYLSGNVREKYKAVKGKKGFEENERMLKAVLPEDIPAKNITPQFGAPWIAPDYVADFLKETFGLYSAPTVNYDPTTGTWTLETNMWGDTTLLTHKYGTKYLNGLKIAEKALNMRNIVVKDSDGKILVKETRAAQQKADDIKAAFEEWCFKDSNRRQELVTTFNEKFNSNRNMDFTELSKYLTFDGLSDTFKLRDYQKRAVARAVFNGNTLLAHGVGTGKTAEMITIAMELKRMGIAKKNMMVVPPHKVADFRNDILKMYPSAKVAMLEKGANATQRKRFYAQVAANDYDIVIIPHTSFGMLDVSEDTKRAFITSQIAELEDVLTQAQLQKGSIDGRFIRQLENQKKRLEEKLKLITESAKDNGNTFEELGVDSLFVDEAHNFKNLPFYSKLSRVAGVSVNQSNNKTRASRAENMFMITDYLNKNNGRITFGTATPITNSMSEIYNMLRFLRPDILEESGIQSFDAWAAMFGSIVNQAEVDPSGRHMRMKERFSKFKNVAQMVEQFRRMADILKTNEVIEDLPVAERIDVVNEPNAIQEEFLDIIDGMIDEIRTSGQNAEHNMLEVTTAGQMAAIDLRFVKSYFNGKYTDEELNLPNNRISQVAKKVIKEYNDSNAIKGTQFVFCDVGVRDDPSKKYNLYVYGDLINRLVAGGIPREEIAIAQDFEDKADLSAKVNTGEIRVLIGSTAVMGEGMNAQNKAVALHHMTVPARPSDIEQREGRIIRYGNENKNVRIYRYIQEKSYDSYQWQMQERKASFINQALSGGTVEELEEMSDFQLTAREAKAIASGNPLLLEKIEVEDKLSKLKSLRNKFNTDKLEMRDRLATLPNRISRLEQSVMDKKADIQTVNANSSEDFEITFGKTKYTDRTKAAGALEKAISKIPKNGTNVLIGSCKGLDVYYSSSLDKGTKFTIKGNDSYIVDGGNSASGNITRILNAIGKIQNSLDIDEKLLKSFKAEIKTLETEVNAEFPQMKELEELQAKLADIDTQLGINISEVDMSDVVVSEEDDDTTDYSKAVGSDSYTDQWATQRVGDSDTEPKSLSEIVARIQHDFDVNITSGHLRGGNVRGAFNKNNEGIRTKLANDLPTITHELGHFLDKKYKLINKSLDKELIKELTDNLPQEMKDVYAENKWKTEGFAEFMRRFMQNREVATIDYPEFTKYFLNTLDGKDAALISQFADDINAYYSLDADTATSSIKLNEEKSYDARTITEKIKDKADVFYQAWVDSNYSIKRFDKATGSNAYTLATNAAYSDAIAGQIIMGDLTDSNGKYVSPGLKTTLNGINLKDENEYRLFGEYLVVKHGPERLEEGMRIFADDRKNSSAFMNKRAEELEQQYPQFAEAAKRFYKFIDDFYRTWAVDTGLISDTALPKWHERWQYYVPLLRDVGETGFMGAKRGFANQNSTIKKARGSSLDVIHPVDGMITNMIKIVNAGTRNNVMRNITRSADRLGANAKFIEKVPTPMKVEKTNIGGVKQQILTKLDELGLSTSDKKSVDEIVTNIDDILIQYGRGKAYGDVITVLENGQPEFWKINDAGLLKSLTTMSPTKMEGILDAYAVVSRFMTSNITGSNLIWSIFSNLPRDFMTLYTYSSTKNPFKLFASCGSAYVNKVKYSLGKEVNPLYREYLAMGGGTISAYSADRDFAKRARKKFAGKKFSLNPLDWIAFVGDTIESGPRFATYKVLREQGMDPREAFYGAMDVTVNFRRGGNWSRQINKVVPFFNAGVQGLDKFGRWITASEVNGSGRKSVVMKRTFGFVTASTILAAITYALNNSDEEKEKEYEQLSTYIKNSFWNIPLGDGKFFAIPKPRELGVLSSFIETGLEYYKGENKHAFDGFYEYFTDNCLPNLVSDISQIGQKGLKETGAGLLGDLGLIGIVGYVVANRDFLGKPIVPASLEKLEKKDQHTDRTSKIAYWIGQAFNASPIEIDYAFEQLLGGFWKYQRALFPVGEANIDYSLGVKNTYFKDNQYSNDIINWMYDNADKSSRAAESDPDNIDKAIANKLDNSLKEFYSSYYGLAKGKPETKQRRATRQDVIDIIYEYRKAVEGDYYKKIINDVKEFCKKVGDESYLPAVMQTKIKDGKKKEHELTDSQYVEYQTYYLTTYWDLAEDSLRGVGNDKKTAAILKEVQTVAREEATNKMLASMGLPKSDFSQKYKGVSNDDIIEFRTEVKLEKEAKEARGESKSLTQAETAEILDDMNLDSDDTYTLFFSQHPNGTSAKDVYDAGVSADDYLYFLAETEDMTADYKMENGEYVLNKRGKKIPIRGSKKEKIDSLLEDMNLSEEEYWALMEVAGYERPLE